MNTLELVQAVEAAGGVLTINGDRLRYGLPHEAATLVKELTEHRDDIVRLLREREQRPAMPAGVRLLAWHPKDAPVVLTRWSVVTDVRGFIRRTLEELEAALAGKNWLAGNWGVKELVDRLDQVGIQVEVTYQ